MSRTRFVVIGIMVACAVALIVVAHLTAPSALLAKAGAKPKKIKNLDAHLQGDENYKKADLQGKLEIIAKLAKARNISSQQQKWMQVRVLEQAAREKGIHGKLPELLKWLGGLQKDYKNPITKAGRYALDEMVKLYGTQRLFQDETFLKGDIPAKLKRVNELFKERELGQSFCYHMNRYLVYKYLAPAQGDIRKELELLGELNKQKAINWAAGGWIEAGLIRRALEEDKTLDSVEKKMRYCLKLVDEKKISWMTTSGILTGLMIAYCENDPEFLKLDHAGRKAKIDQWKKDGFISNSEKRDLLATYAE